MCTLEDTNALFGTPISVGGGVVYVPDNLLLAYRNNINWKNYIIMPIDKYPYDPIGAEWEEVINNTTTYATDYEIGKTLPIVIGGMKYYMELIAIDTDDKADGSGKARMTWMSTTCITTTYVNSAGNTNYNGWLITTLRSNLRSTMFWDKLPEILRNNIVAVNKTYYDYTSKTTKTSVDTIWIPSAREMFGPNGGGSYTIENSGIDYTNTFTNNSLKKRPNGGANWWLRSARSNSDLGFLSIVNSDGSLGANNASASRGVVPCFCI